MTMSHIPENTADFFRDPPIRYFGYANELGEAFRPFVPVVLVRSTYGVASLYAMADACHKGYQANDKYTEVTPYEVTKESFVSRAVMDTLIWQGLASVLIPGFTINRIVWVTRTLLSSRFPKSSRSVATMMGLLSIPAIIHPIDRAVDCLMNHTFRRYFSASTKPLDSLHIVKHERDD